MRTAVAVVVDRLRRSRVEGVVRRDEVVAAVGRGGSAGWPNH